MREVDSDVEEDDYEYPIDIFPRHKSKAELEKEEKAKARISELRNEKAKKGS